MLTRLLCAFSADAAGELYVFRHDGYSLGVDRTEVCVFEETNQIGFACLLQCHHSRALEAQLSLEILGDLTDETLEGQLADEKFGALLVAADFSEGNCAGPVAMRLLNTAGGRSAFSGCLSRQLFSGCFSSGRLASCLLGTSHLESVSGRALGISIEVIRENELTLRFPPFYISERGFRVNFVTAMVTCDWSVLRIFCFPRRRSEPEVNEGQVDVDCVQVIIFHNLLIMFISACSNSVVLTNAYLSVTIHY